MVTQLKEINSGVFQDRILEPVLYLLYTADLRIALGSITATYADDTAVLAAHNNHMKASLGLQESLYHIQRWFKKWRIEANETKSVQMIFITCRKICSPITLNDQRILQAEDAKYLELHLDRKVNWKKHIYQA